MGEWPSCSSSIIRGLASALWFYEENEPFKVTAYLEVDFVRLATSRFLDYLVEYCCASRGKPTDCLAGHCMLELHQRKCKLSFTTYQKALALYKSEKFTFNLLKLGHLQLASMNPGLPVARDANYPNLIVKEN